MNIHRLKSYHETALDSWNGVSRILSEAADLNDAKHRHQNFIKAVIALTDIAGDNHKRRGNIIKGADVALHGILEAETPLAPTLTKKNSKPERPGTFKRIATAIIRTIIVVFLLAGLVGAFFLGRTSMRPAFSSTFSMNAPALSSDAGPEEIVKKYFDAAQLGDMASILALCDREKITHEEYIMEEARDVGEALAKIKEIKTVSVEQNQTAKVVVELMSSDGRFETGEFRLKAHDGQWRFPYIDF